MSKYDSLGTLKEVRLAQGTVRYRESGAGEPIVFVHGLLVNGDLWRKVVPELAKHYRCIVPDWPLGGHEIALNADTDLTPPGVARLIADFMAALELYDVTLVGSDTGGAMSQLVITNHPERIKQLVLTNCDAYENFFPLAFRYFQWGGWVPGFVPGLAQLLKLKPAATILMKTVAKHPVEQKAVDSYLHTGLWDKAVQRDLGKVLRGVSNRYTLAAAKKFANFTRPVLLVWATDDPFFTSKDARRLSQDFPNARLEMVKDSRAFVSEDQPEKLAEFIKDFIRSAANVR